MTSLSTSQRRRDPLEKTPNKSHSMKKTISRDVSSSEEELNRKLHIFRVQEQARERSSLNSTLNSSRPSAAPLRDATSGHDHTGTRPNFKSTLGARIDDKRREWLKDQTSGSPASSGVQAIGAALPTNVRAFQTQNAEPQIKATSKEGEQASIIVPQSKKKAIQFQDCMGRKFSFPIDVCNTWPKMKELISHAFMYMEAIGPHVTQGHYDLVGPNGDIILPDRWETVLALEWTVTMRMWPIPEQPGPPQVQNPRIPPTGYLQNGKTDRDFHRG